MKKHQLTFAIRLSLLVFIASECPYCFVLLPSIAHYLSGLDYKITDKIPFKNLFIICYKAYNNYKQLYDYVIMLLESFDTL